MAILFLKVILLFRLRCQTGQFGESLKEKLILLQKVNTRKH